MGYEYTYTCKKCGHEYFASFGVGMLYSKKYAEVVQAARDGKYGEEWKVLMNSCKDMAIDASLDAYICKCGSWKNEENLSIYAPIAIENIDNEQLNFSASQDMEEIPCVWDLNEGYQLIKEYIHKCDKCGMTMHRIDDSEAPALPCPMCGTVNSCYPCLILWD